MNVEDTSGDRWQQRFRLDGRVALITGGAGLLGKEYCHLLSQVGAHVVIADIDGPQAEQVAAGLRDLGRPEPLAAAVDVSDPDSVSEMMARITRTFQRVDILVNNAALDPKFDPQHREQHTNDFENFSLSDWQEALDVNVTGMFLCAQAVSKPMRSAGKGVIVNVSSTYGLVGPDQRLYQREGEPPAYKPVTYTISKAAALGLTRYLATYFRGTGIRVNSLTPGGVYNQHDPEFVERYSAKTVLGRMAEREEMSMALLFLVSDASSYMTGANLVVDGGWTAW